MTKRISVGEKIRGFPAETWNQLVDSMGDSGGDSLPSPPAAAAPSLSHALVVTIVNKSGGSVAEYEILGIDDAARTPPDIGATNDTATRTILDGVQIECVTPTHNDHYGNFVITLQPIADDGTGLALLAGITWARVDVTSTSHEYAELDATDPTEFASTWGGPVHILWKPTGTGSKWCIVEFPPRGCFLIGKTDEAITARSSTTPGTGTVSVYRTTTAGLLEDVTTNVEAYNLSESAVASGAYVGLILIGARWWVFWEDCG